MDFNDKSHVDIDFDGRPAPWSLGMRQRNDDKAMRYLVQRGIPEHTARHRSMNEFCYWTEQELDELFDDMDISETEPLNQLVSFRISSHTPSEQFVKPSLSHIEQSAKELGALCVDKEGNFCTNPKEGYAALSHVWREGLGADNKNRGLHKDLLDQVFAKVEKLGIRWIWTDSLAIPGGGGALTTHEMELKSRLINAMASIYRMAEYVVVIDALCLRLRSTDPAKVAAALFLGQWTTRIWTYQEVKLATNLVVITAQGSVALDPMIKSMEALALQETGFLSLTRAGAGKHAPLYRSLDRLQRKDEVELLLSDVALGSATRHASDPLDYARALFPTLKVEWKSTYDLSEAFHTLFESQKAYSSQLCLWHGPPRSLRLGWAPARLHDLISGHVIDPGHWEDHGIRRNWWTTRVKRLCFLDGEVGLMRLDSETAMGAWSQIHVSKSTREESPGSIEIFKVAVRNKSAYLLTNSPLKAEKHFADVGLLVCRRREIEGFEAWVCLTTMISSLEPTYKADLKNWLLFHENPTTRSDKNI